MATLSVVSVASGVALAGTAVAADTPTSAAATTTAATPASDGSDTGGGGVVSQSQGQFLTGSTGGQDLAMAAKLEPATAINTGGPTVTVSNPLDVTLLGQVPIPIGHQQLPIGDATGLRFGALNQYATADPDGSASSSSGAIADNGALGANGTGGTAGDASLNLANLFSSLSQGSSTAITSQLGNVTLTGGALAGRATQAPFTGNGTPGAQAGTYQIGALKLTLTSPALAALYSQLSAPLTTAITGVTTAVTALNANGVVTVNNPPTSAALLTGLTSVSSSDGSITGDLSTGTLTIDVAKLLAASGTDINNLPPNTDLLPLILRALTNFGPSLSSLLSGLSANFSSAFAATTVTITLPAGGLGALPGGAGGQLGGLLGGALGQLPGGAGSPVQQNGGTTTVPLGSLLDAGQLSSLVNAAGSGLTSVLAPFSSAGLTQLAAALGQVLGLVANGQQTSSGRFTETALEVAVLPSSGATPTALQLDLGGASVAPGTPLTAAVVSSGIDAESTTLPAAAPQLANTGATTLPGMAIGAWALAAGLALVAAVARFHRRFGRHAR